MTAGPTMKAREIIFISAMGFAAAWTVLSVYGLIQAMAGYTDTYASVVASQPALATSEARQAVLQGVIIEHVVRWSVIAGPLGLIALLAKW
jgi:hypothetical protein